jgi:hypothetical protein
LFQRGSRSAVSEVHEAMAVVADCIRAWQQGGPRPTYDDDEFSGAMERMGAWLDEIPTTFNRRAVNAALREKSEEWTCTSAST